MNRLLFEKTGDAVYLSHLDLMRIFQRAFRRADILIWHSQGFSPRAYVSIALPLSVGVESRCEILDFEIEDGSADLAKLPELLNRTMPAGIRVLRAYESAVKVKHLTYLHMTPASRMGRRRRSRRSLPGMRSWWRSGARKAAWSTSTSGRCCGRSRSGRCRHRS